jgi:hypothetical protein
MLKENANTDCRWLDVDIYLMTIQTQTNFYTTILTSLTNYAKNRQKIYQISRDSNTTLEKIYWWVKYFVTGKTPKFTSKMNSLSGCLITSWGKFWERLLRNSRKETIPQTISSNPCSLQNYQFLISCSITASFAFRPTKEVFASFLLRCSVWEWLKTSMNLLCLLKSWSKLSNNLFVSFGNQW